jgi:hypothetical protein
MALTVQSCTNPKWNDAASTSIHCTVKFVERSAPLDFVAMASDPEPHGSNLFARLEKGEFGPIAPYVPLPAAAKAPSPSIGTNKV